MEKKKTNKRVLYSSITFGILILFAMGIYAYGTFSPSTFGHTWDEVSPPTGCVAEQFLKWTGSAWSCASRGLNLWTQKASYPGTGGLHMFGFNIGTKGYAGGGINQGGTVLYASYEYNPSTNAWTQKASFPTSAAPLKYSFSIGSKGYVIGVTYSSTPYVASYYLYEYNPSTNAWTQKAKFPVTGTGSTLNYYGFAFSIGDKGYFGLGKSFYEYDPTTNAWTQKASFAGAEASQLNYFSVGDKGYVGGGITSQYATMQPTFYEYDPTTNAWTQKASYPLSSAYGQFSFPVSEKGYAGCGLYTYEKRVWEYS